MSPLSSRLSSLLSKFGTLWRQVRRSSKHKELQLQTMESSVDIGIDTDDYEEFQMSFATTSSLCVSSELAGIRRITLTDVDEGSVQVVWSAGETDDYVDEVENDNDSIYDSYFVDEADYCTAEDFSTVCLCKKCRDSKLPEAPQPPHCKCPGCMINDTIRKSKIENKNETFQLLYDGTESPTLPTEAGYFRKTPKCYCAYCVAQRSGGGDIVRPKVICVVFGEKAGNGVEFGTRGDPKVPLIFQRVWNLFEPFKVGRKPGLFEGRAMFYKSSEFIEIRKSNLMICIMGGTNQIYFRDTRQPKQVTFYTV